MRNVMTIHAVLLLLLVGGCAKRPATAQGSASAPTRSSAAATTSRPQPATPAAAETSRPGAGRTDVAASTARPAPKDFTPVAALKSVNFDFDKYEIRPADVKILQTNAAWLKDNAKHLVLIEGHCDGRGTNEHNVALGERRAKAAMSYLVGQGIRANRITIVSYGEERPLCTDQSEACWARNRRAQFLVKPE